MPTNNNRYAAPHVWNLVAKQMREAPVAGNIETDLIGVIALRFAERFNRDEGFDPISFLMNCNPTDNVHFEKLWPDAKG